MSEKPQNLEDALKKINILEAEISELKKKLEHYENKDPGGRRKHDEKWQASYQQFVDLYVAGNPISYIVEVSDFSRRTAYRYKEYYDKLAKSENSTNTKKGL